MKTHANQPDEIALLNHVSTYVGKTCYVVHRLDKETSGALVFAKNPFVLPVLKSTARRQENPTRLLGLNPRQLTQKAAGL